jgi:uncharacterized protein YegJ (DUF2314 family)
MLSEHQQFFVKSLTEIERSSGTQQFSKTESWTNPKRTALINTLRSPHLHTDIRVGQPQALMHDACKHTKRVHKTQNAAFLKKYFWMTSITHDSRIIYAALNNIPQAMCPKKGANVSF